MIKDRVITVINHSGMKLPELEEKTGISRYTWSNLKNPAKKREIKEEEITAIAKAFPDFRWWILTGEEEPTIGQISPPSSENQSENNKQMDEIDRLVYLWTTTKRSRKSVLAKLGIDYNRFAQVMSRKIELRASELIKIAGEFPEHEYWILTGKEFPEIGQVKP